MTIGRYIIIQIIIQIKITMQTNELHLSAYVDLIEIKS